MRGEAPPRLLPVGAIRVRVEAQKQMNVTMESQPEAKVRLFRALFRGREDVYARRYVSAKSGKSGYSPACAVEWSNGLCDKKRVACAVCPL